MGSSQHNIDVSQDEDEQYDAGVDILQAMASQEEGGESRAEDYKKKMLSNFCGEQIHEVRSRVEEETGDPESYRVRKIVIGKELAGIASAKVDLEFDEPIAKVADVPVGMKQDGSGVYCQILVSQKPRLLIMHYTYQGEGTSGKGTVEASAPVFGDEEAEIEHFLTNME